MSVQQIVRELPSAAMGLNMFFLAISNNLPILTDEIKRAKAAIMSPIPTKPHASSFLITHD
jgi:hypothetical protein